MPSLPKLGIANMSAPLGNRTPHAVGAGYFYRTNNMNKVACSVFGEGAASEGDIHASMNFASTLNTQSMFFVRNNVNAISTFIEDQYAGDGISSRGEGYGMPSIKVDGMDIFAVYNAVKIGREMVMKNKIPVLIEAFTYRFGDHSTSDS